MKLGNLKLSRPLFLAPLSGITNYPFRKLALKYGCDAVFTEMISAEGLVRKRNQMVKIEKDEHPIILQLFGSDPEILAEASEVAKDLGADGIDINMGCPGKNVVRVGAGASLLMFPKKVEEILSRVRKRVKGILTMKIRSGWDDNHINAIDISKIAEDCGVDAVFLHPRTKIQGFRGKANWRIIKEVKEATKIPIIGNGDVKTKDLIKKMFDETGCDGVMIGRGALGNPWIFDREIKGLPGIKEKKEVINYHFSQLLTYYKNEKALRFIKTNIYWYTRGLPNSTSFRKKISSVRNIDELFKEINYYFDFLEECNSCKKS